jgi:signal recognition particle subunit SRP54
MIIKIVNEELTELMGGGNAKLVISPKPPTVVMLVGLQGAVRQPTAPSWPLHEKQNGKRPFWPLRHLSSCRHSTMEVVGRS